MQLEHEIATADDIPTIARIHAHGFAVEEEKVPAWIERVGLQNSRVVRVHGEVAATVFQVPMGLWLGGKNVSNLGVAGVGVGAEHRGAGLARGIMQATLREGRARGIAVSTLYPATHTLYRAVGYELAGALFETSVRLEGLKGRAEPLPIRRFTSEDREAVRKLRSAWARTRNGELERGEYMWNRVESPRFHPANGFVVEEDGAIAGYVFLRSETTQMPYHDLHVSDLVAESGRAARRLWSFLADHRSLARQAHLMAGPEHPLLRLLPERCYEVKFVEHWMLRILDVKRALEARGYALGHTAEVTLRVRDPDLPENTGSWHLQVEGGIAQCLPATANAGGLALDVRALASLFTGFASAAELRALGEVKGDDEAVRTADAVFSGRAPVMSEMF